MSLADSENSLVVLPAYGRSYEDGDAAQKDWDAGKDFQITGGPEHGRYCSNRDVNLMKSLGITHVIIGTASGNFLKRIEL